MNFKETVLTLLKDSMLYKTRQSLLFYSKTFKDFQGTYKSRIQSTNIVEFAKIQFGLKIVGGGGGGSAGSYPGSTTVTFQRVKRKIMCVLIETRVSRS